VFGFHRLAVRDCVERNQVPKVHAYSDHVFIVLHAPERGRGGPSTTSSSTNSSGPGSWSPYMGRWTRRSLRRSRCARPPRSKSGWSRDGCARPRHSSCPTRSSPPWPATRRPSWRRWPRRRVSWSSG
jgi:hypothetical protein